jgi:glyoxylase-like metal-dependent hydrolase (beta-lactamase superfamily II)
LIFRKTGPVSDKLHVTGLPWSPSYLLAGEEPVLFEAGFHCMGRFYERDVVGVLSARQPATLFLTHVHWDHCGAAAYLKNIFPSMNIAASEKAAAIMARPHAIELMKKLSATVVPLIESIEGIDPGLLIREPFEPFRIDTVLADGQVVPLGNEMSVHVLSSPGHTWDLLSYYIPEERILIATEASGLLWQNGFVGTEFLVDFDQYMTSLNRIAELDAAILCQGHHFVFTGEEVKKFLASSIEAALRFRDDVEHLLIREKGAVERVVEIIKEGEYDPNRGIKQMEQAYLLNLRARVAHLAMRLKERICGTGTTGTRY